MRKIISMILAMSLVFALIGCHAMAADGNGGGNGKSPLEIASVTVDGSPLNEGGEVHTTGSIDISFTRGMSEHKDTTISLISIPGVTTTVSFDGDRTFSVKYQDLKEGSYQLVVGKDAMANNDNTLGADYVFPFKVKERHRLEKTEAKAATCTDAGNREYYTCTTCGKLFSDSEGTNEITNADTVIAAKGHSFGEWKITKEATEKEEGQRERVCSVCGEKETKSIPALSPSQNPAAPIAFSDVKTSNYYYNAVQWAVKKGITSGTSNTTFNPNAACTRAHVMTFLWRASGSPEPKTTVNQFKDITADNYYYKPVLWAIEKGITAGKSKNSFAPNDPCTRGQVMTFLWRAAGSPNISATNPFKDVQSSAYYYKPVLWAVNKGITYGTSSNTFSPQKTCTRAQVVTFLYKNAGYEPVVRPVQEKGVPDGTYQTVLEGFKMGAQTSMYKIEVVNNCVVIYGSFLRYENPSQLDDMDYFPAEVTNGRYAFPINGNTGIFYNERIDKRVWTGDKPYSSVNQFAKEVQEITDQSAKVTLVIIVKNGTAQRMTLYLK